MNKRKIILIFFGLTFIITIYLILMSYVDEKSIGLLESIIEVENMDSSKKAIELAKIAQQKKDIINLKYLYGAIMLSYLGGVIYWFGFKKK